MTTGSWLITEVDAKNLSDGEAADLYHVWCAVEAEAFPEDPPMSLQTFSAWQQNQPTAAQRWLWLARDGAGRAVGTARANSFSSGANSHLAHLELKVVAAVRRHGLGRELLRRATERAVEKKKTVVAGWTNDRLDASAAFCRRVGATEGLRQHVNRLLLAEVDRRLLADWVAEAERRSGTDYELVTGDIPVPDDMAEAVVDAFNVMADAPRDEMRMEHREMTVDELRVFEAAAAASGASGWALFARERATGRLVGLTTVYWSPEHPSLVEQGDTGVRAEHRGRALGKWLKAAMLERIFAERPEATEVRTGNADSNAAMLAVNHRLGFRPYVATTGWQADAEVLQRYLAETARAP